MPRLFLSESCAPTYDLSDDPSRSSVDGPLPTTPGLDVQSLRVNKADLPTRGRSPRPRHLSANSQPALSQQMKRLEQRLGVTGDWSRVGRSVRLTEAGRVHCRQRSVGDDRRWMPRQGEISRASAACARGGVRLVAFPAASPTVGAAPAHGSRRAAPPASGLTYVEAEPPEADVARAARIALTIALTFSYPGDQRRPARLEAARRTRLCAPVGADDLLAVRSPRGNPAGARERVRGRRTWPNENWIAGCPRSARSSARALRTGRHSSRRMGSRPTHRVVARRGARRPRDTAVATLPAHGGGVVPRSGPASSPVRSRTPRGAHAPCPSPPTALERVPAVAHRARGR
jgi:DNA-binding transcriptional LysR family regulator